MKIQSLQEGKGYHLNATGSWPRWGWHRGQALILTWGTWGLPLNLNAGPKFQNIPMLQSAGFSMRNINQLGYQI